MDDYYYFGIAGFPDRIEFQFLFPFMLIFSVGFPFNRIVRTFNQIRRHAGYM